jgi:hypothetical protein
VIWLAGRLVQEIPVQHELVRLGDVYSTVVLYENDPCGFPTTTSCLSSCQPFNSTGCLPFAGLGDTLKVGLYRRAAIRHVLTVLY